MEKETNLFNININTEIPIEELNYIRKYFILLNLFIFLNNYLNYK